jgi:hypothetical protein
MRMCRNWPARVRRPPFGWTDATTRSPTGRRGPAPGFPACAREPAPAPRTSKLAFRGDHASLRGSFPSSGSHRGHSDAETAPRIRGVCSRAQARGAAGQSASWSARLAPAVVVQRAGIISSTALSHAVGAARLPSRLALPASTFFCQKLSVRSRAGMSRAARPHHPGAADALELAFPVALWLDSADRSSTAAARTWAIGV